MAEIRMTKAAKKVITALAGAETMYGTELVEATGLRSGTIHPLLRRLEAVGYVRSRWERISESKAGRRKRRFYRLTAKGRRLHEALA